MRTVWLAISGEDDGTTRGVFSTREKADAFVAHRIQTTRYKRGWQVSEFTVDEKARP